MKFEIYCRYQDFAMRLDFYIFEVLPNGTKRICTSLDKVEFKEWEPGLITDPSFSLNGMIVKPFLQEMANTLKEIGIKAEGDPILENELSATKYHLEDMRTLVFQIKRKSQ